MHLSLLPKYAASDSTKMQLVIKVCNKTHLSQAMCMLGEDLGGLDAALILRAAGHLATEEGGKNQSF